MSQINRTSVQEPGAVAEMSASITQMIFDGVHVFSTRISLGTLFAPSEGYLWEACEAVRKKVPPRPLRASSSSLVL